jgi:hypothetical protein
MMPRCKRFFGMFTVVSHSVISAKCFFTRACAERNPHRRELTPVKRRGEVLWVLRFSPAPRRALQPAFAISPHNARSCP